MVVTKVFCNFALHLKLITTYMKLLLQLGLLAATQHAFAQQPSHQLVFNEVMQSNINNLMVENDFPDSWVELYNPGTSNVNIRGWRIGSSTELDDCYTLPSAVVNANGHLVIYCDKEDKGLHTDFRIDSGKSVLYLFDQTGTMVDSLALKKMPAPNVAFGRTEDNADSWYYEFTPTPGTANAGGGSMTVLPEPVFNEQGGIYEGYKLVTISKPEGAPADAGIFFTLDGSEPTRKSQGSLNPQISFSGNKIVRARLISISNTAIPSPVVTQSYITPERQSDLPVVSIVTDNDYLYSAENGILAGSTNGATPNYMQKWRRPLNIEYFGAGATEGEHFNQLAEMAISGVSTREEPQKSLKLYANKRFGTKNFKGVFWNTKPDVKKVKSFALRNGGNNASSSRINDATVQTVFGTHMDNIDWQAYQPVIVYLNGKYFGEFGMRERSNEDYVEANYGLEDIEIADEVSYQSPVEGTLFNEFFKTYTNEHSTYEELSQLIDVDNFVKTTVAEVYAMNTDYPTNNISLWTRTDAPAQWRWIIKDMDRFGVMMPLYPPSFDMIRYLFEPDDLMYGGMHHFDLYKKMISFPEVRNSFIDQMSVSLGDFLKADLVNAVADSLANQIKDEVRATFSVYNYSMSDFNSGLNNLKRVVSGRADNLYSQMNQYFNLGGIVPLRIVAGDVPVTINGIALTEGDFDGKCFVNHPLTIDAVDTECQWIVKAESSRGTSVLKVVPGNSLALDVSELSLAGGVTIVCEPEVSLETGIREVNDNSSLFTDSRHYTIDGKLLSAPNRQNMIEIIGRKKFLK